MARAVEAARNGQLRVGLLSPDLREHSVAYFVEPLLSAWNRDRVYSACYVTVPHEDAVTQRLMSKASAWRIVIGPLPMPLLLPGLQPLAAVKGRSSMRVAGITRSSSAAEYSSGLMAEPGWRQLCVTWLNGWRTKSKPPTANASN